MWLCHCVRLSADGTELLLFRSRKQLAQPDTCIMERRPRLDNRLYCHKRDFGGARSR